MTASSKAEERTGFLFEEAHLQAQAQAIPELLGPTLRLVSWEKGLRPCLVRCEDGERNIRRIRTHTTLCGISCSDAISTTARPPSDGLYCITCLSLSGNGVLR